MTSTQQQANVRCERIDSVFVCQDLDSAVANCAPLFAMIHPEDAGSSVPSEVLYKIVAWENDLPAFDPLPKFKTLLLRSSSVKTFDRAVARMAPLLGPFIFIGLILRFATFALPARVGCVLAPISAVLHLPGLVVIFAEMKSEYVKLILRTFDFCFLQAANTLWAIALSSVMRDLRIAVVLMCWLNFTFWLLQETYLHNSSFIVGVALLEWLFYVLLLPALSLELVDGLRHCTLLTARGHSLSTKDLLVNAIGTMTMMSLRNLYQRYQDVKHRRRAPTAAMRALGFRCKIALVSGPSMESFQYGVLPPMSALPRQTTSSSRTLGLSPSKHLPMQMFLAAEPDVYDARHTVWRRIGGLTALATWQTLGLYACGTAGGIFAAISMFIPVHGHAARAIAVSGTVASFVFSSVYACCCQRQLLQRIMTSFHFLFFAGQILATAFCVVDIFSWRWIPASGVVSSLFLAFTILTVDALTPAMKRRLRFSFWLVVHGILLFWLVEMALLVDVLVLGNWGLQDRVFLDVTLLSRRAKFHVAPFMLSRVVTIVVWSGRFIYVTLSRRNDNAFILLRGTVEFDYERWKREAHLDPLRRHQGVSAPRET
jgi:hypothetical protein